MGLQLWCRSGQEWPLPDDPGAAILQVDAPDQAVAFQK
jgi:hypothetical protein